jgi:hypothetical protein
MKPNLKSYEALSMQFSATLPLSDELISRVQNVSPPDKDGDSGFFDSYNGHRAYAWVMAYTRNLDKDMRKYRINFNYEAEKGRRLRMAVPRIEQLVEILSSLKETVNFECNVGFKFGKRLKPKPIISLPIKYTESPRMPFDTIQGLHLVKRSGGKPQYEVILEAGSPREIVALTYFTYASNIQKSLPDKILKHGAEIAKEFVTKEK